MEEWLRDHNFLDNGSNNSVVIGTHTAPLVLKSTTTTITQLVLTRHNIRLTYSKYLRLVIVFIASDIALAPSLPMELLKRL